MKVVRKLRILLVEDSHTGRVALERDLKKEIASVVISAIHGEDALEKLEADPEDFDCIVSDQQMPEMNGLALLRFIRKWKRYENVPFILVTSLADNKGFVKLARDAGATAVLGKPVLYEVFTKAVLDATTHP